MTATALRQVVDRRCLDEKGFASELFHELAWWKEVRPLTSFVDAVVQPHRRDIDHYDAYVLSIIWSWLQSGRLVRAFKSIGVTPCRDACASENQRSLNGVFGITAKVRHQDRGRLVRDLRADEQLRSARQTLVDDLDELRQIAPKATEEILGRLENRAPTLGRQVRHRLVKRGYTPPLKRVRTERSPKREWHFDMRALWIEFRDILLDTRDDLQECWRAARQRRLA